MPVASIPDTSNDGVSPELRSDDESTGLICVSVRMTKSEKILLESVVKQLSATSGSFVSMSRFLVTSAMWRIRQLGLTQNNKEVIMRRINR